LRVEANKTLSKIGIMMMKRRMITMKMRTIMRKRIETTWKNNNRYRYNHNPSKQKNPLVSKTI